MTEQQLIAEAISKKFIQVTEQIDILRDLNLVVKQGDSMAIIGASGSGKTTLLNLLAGLDQPDQGVIRINGYCLSACKDSEGAKLRNAHIGLIYQHHYLLPEFNAVENIAMPLLIRRVRYHDAIKKARALLERVDLIKRANHLPGELSGGERQRVAIGRALITEPSYILADEPTGSLDEQHAQQVFELILQLCDEGNNSLIMVTHNLELASKLGRVMCLRNGHLTQN